MSGLMHCDAIKPGWYGYKTFLDQGSKHIFLLHFVFIVKNVFFLFFFFFTSCYYAFTFLETKFTCIQNFAFVLLFVNLKPLFIRLGQDICPS